MYSNRLSTMELNTETNTEAHISDRVRNDGFNRSYSDYIKCDQYILRELSSEYFNIQELLEFYGGHKIPRYCVSGNLRPTNLYKVKRLVELLQKMRSNDEQLKYLVQDIESDKIVGSILIKDIDWDVGECTMCVFIDDSMVADVTEIIDPTVCYIVTELGIDLVQIRVPDIGLCNRINDILQRLGGSYEGTFRTGNKDEYQKHYRWSITGEEYEGQSSSYHGVEFTN